MWLQREPPHADLSGQCPPPLSRRARRDVGLRSGAQPLRGDGWPVSRGAPAAPARGPLRRAVRVPLLRPRLLSGRQPGRAGADDGRRRGDPRHKPGGNYESRGFPGCAAAFPREVGRQATFPGEAGTVWSWRATTPAIAGRGCATSTATAKARPSSRRLSSGWVETHRATSHASRTPVNSRPSAPAASAAVAIECPVMKDAPAKARAQYPMRRQDGVEDRVGPVRLVRQPRRKSAR